MKKKGLIVFILFIVIAAVAAGVSYYLYSEKNTVATVNGEKISKAEFTMYMLMFREQLESGQTFSTDAARQSYWQTQISGGETLEAITKNNILDYLREQKTAIAKAKDEGISLTDEEGEYAKSQVQSIIDEYFSGKRLDADKAYMEYYGVTLAQYEKFMQYDILSQKYKSMLSDNLVPPTKEVTDRYAADESLYDTVTVRHILYLTTDTSTGVALTEDKVAAAKVNAEKALEKVKSGDDMVAIAKAESEDTGVTQNNGKYVFNKFGMYADDGTFTAFTYSSSLDADFMAWAFSAKVGDTGIVETQFGYHVMKLEERKTTELSAVQQYISSEIIEMKLIEEMESWKEDRKYDIKVNDVVFKAIRIV